MTLGHDHFRPQQQPPQEGDTNREPIDEGRYPDGQDPRQYVFPHQVSPNQALDNHQNRLRTQETETQVDTTKDRRRMIRRAVYAIGALVAAGSIGVVGANIVGANDPAPTSPTPDRPSAAGPVTPGQSSEAAPSSTAEASQEFESFSEPSVFRNGKRMNTVEAGREIKSELPPRTDGEAYDQEWFKAFMTKALPEIASVNLMTTKDFVGSDKFDGTSNRDGNIPNNKDVVPELLAEVTSNPNIKDDAADLYNLATKLSSDLSFISNIKKTPYHLQVSLLNDEGVRSTQPGGYKTVIDDIHFEYVDEDGAALKDDDPAIANSKIVKNFKDYTASLQTKQEGSDNKVAGLTLRVH